MTESDTQATGGDIEAGNFVNPVDLGDDSDGQQIVGTDPEHEKGDYTMSTDHGDGEETPQNRDRPDGDYTETESNPDDAVEDGEYTDREKR